MQGDRVFACLVEDIVEQLLVEKVALVERSEEPAPQVMLKMIDEFGVVHEIGLPSTGT
jgi:hypothetical protein